MKRTSRRNSKRGALVAAALLLMTVATSGATAAATTTSEASADPLVGLYDQVAKYAPADYTANSWRSFSSARNAAARLIRRENQDPGRRGAARAKLQSAADGLVMVRGLKSLVADYKTRSASEYTGDSWAPFAKALNSAASVAADASATAPEVASAKTELMTTAADLERADGGTFETITNDVFWNDTDGNPIYSQGGGVFKFGDTYYWYGVHYKGAEYYRSNPTRKYNNDVTFVSIPVYSSQDLVNWKFENNVATTSTGLYGWVGRLGVVYNENTGKYVLITQLGDAVAFLQGDTPTDDFEHVRTQRQIDGNVTEGTGDQTVFTDEDGQDYLVYSNKHGRNHVYVSKIRDSDSLYIERAVEIGYHRDGREGNAMFKLNGNYHTCASDLHGWNTSVNYCIDSTSGNIQGDYSGWYTLSGTEMDYSHVTQTGFFVTVQGTEETTVLYAGDRWADFAWNGIGYNQWVPMTEQGGNLQFHSMSQWQFNVTTGEWRVGPQNNYILNPDIQADRIIVSNVRGWRNIGGWSSNTDGGANGSRFALQMGDGGGVEQRIESVPSGEYTLSLYARGNSGQVVVTGANGNQRTLNVPSSGGWAERQLTGIELPSGAATVTVRASGSGAFTVDQLSLVKTDDGPPPGQQRYEAEDAPAVCQGTIDSDHAGYSGSGFCNGDRAVGAYAEFTVTPEAAGTAKLGVRFANGAEARPANLVVNGTTVETVSFEPTGSWSTWSTKTLSVSLNEGSNTIRLDPTTAEGLPNVDYLDLEVEVEQPVRYEAEDAPATCDGSIDTNHSGYSGSGFCNGDQAVGAAVQFTVDVSASGAASLVVRFANGASSARPANLVVNGTTVGTVSFEPTGSWSTWSTKTLTVSLNSGSNTIRLDPTTAAGLPNVDYLDVGPAA